MTVLKDLSTKIEFIKGDCGHPYKSEIKPSLYIVPKNQTILSAHAIPIMTIILRKCLQIKGQEETVIICSNLKQIQLVEYALRRLGKDFITKNSNANENKSQTIETLDEPGMILITDYRLLRGLEVLHSIVFIDKEEENAAGLLVETLTRTITQLDMIVLPKSHKRTSLSGLERALKSYESGGLVGAIRLKVKQRGGRVNITVTEHGSTESFDETLSEEDYQYEKMIENVGPQDEELFNTFRNRFSLKQKRLKWNGEIVDKITLKNGRTLSFQDVYELLKSKKFEEFNEIAEEYPHMLNNLRGHDDRTLLMKVVSNNNTDRTLLMKAVMENDTGVVNHLLDFPQDVFIVDRKGNNFMHDACMVANEDTLRLLDERLEGKDSLT
uniref:Uncharacterized protein n=2 Tax=Clytia hemisphaerica TaxID=252671 RepID=A0A7M5V245_9CNID